MNERFDLASWELAPDSPEKLAGVASGRVKGDWLGEEREFSLREVEINYGVVVVFAREVDSEDEGSWVLCDNTVPKTYSSWRTRSNGAMNLFAKTQGRPLGRVFHLSFVPYGTPYDGFIVATGESQSYLYLFMPDHDVLSYSHCSFRLPLNDLREANGASWFRRIQDELSDPTSDIRFSLVWAMLPFEEAIARLVNFQRGSYTELLRVLKCVLSFYAPTSTTSQEWRWEVAWPDKEGAWLTGGGHSHPIFLELERWQEAVLQWFEPSYNEELRSRHGCVSQFVRDCEPLLGADVSPPTQHERLEAALELRDWARGKVSEELIATLLSLAPM